jgi:hypothetical protein
VLERRQDNITVMAHAEHLFRPWWPPSYHGRYCAPPHASRYTTISQHATQQVYVVKTRCARHVDDNNVVAGDNACSCTWAIPGSFQCNKVHPMDLLASFGSLIPTAAARKAVGTYGPCRGNLVGLPKQSICCVDGCRNESCGKIWQCHRPPVPLAWVLLARGCKGFWSGARGGGGENVSIPMVLMGLLG